MDTFSLPEPLTVTPELGRLSLREHDIGYLVQRLARVFSRRPVISAWGLQYRLCETGPAKLDPRLLIAALQRISGTGQSPTRPLPGLFADPTADPTTIPALASECVTAATALKEAIGTIRPNDLARAFGLVPNPSVGKKVDEQIGYRRLVESIRLRTHSIVGTIKRRREVRAWVLNDLSWLYPDDPRLWILLRRHGGSEQSLLIIARKIAPVTFHLLKSMGARAVQFYSLLCAHEPGDDVRTAADSIGLPHLLSLPAVREHSVRKQIRASIQALSARPTPNDSIADALVDAGRRGFGDGHRPRPAELLEWTEASKIAWPPVWSQTLYAWANTRRLPLSDAEAAASQSPHEPTSNFTDDKSEPSPGDADGPVTDRAWDTNENHSMLGVQDNRAPDGNIRVGRVVAEVDRETWERLKKRRGRAVR